jgi:hypothetical protein
VLSDDAGNASVADSRTRFVATHFGLAEAASGSPGRDWPNTPRPPFPFEPAQPPKMDIPKGKPKRKKK